MKTIGNQEVSLLLRDFDLVAGIGAKPRFSFAESLSQYPFFQSFVRSEINTNIPL
ncbi:hypothetical protein ABIE66_004204 [Peribacillus sp. B2I2]|uniref:hypothetical protein n=1 Tax=Peribacillus sp. B2I2 TaxID=3156468 RepID=UPI00351142AB